MEAVWQSIVAGAPVLLLHVGIALAILIAGTILYVWMTPWEDLKLVREGNTAAGVALGGIILGLGIPIAASRAVISACRWCGLMVPTMRLLTPD